MVRLSNSGDQKLMEDDPMRFIDSLMGKKLWNHFHVMKALILTVVCYLQIFNVMCIVDIILYQDINYLKYLPGVFLQQPGCFGLAISSVFIKDFFQYQQIVFDNFWSISSGDEKTKNRILRECGIIKLVCIISCGLCILNHSCLIPFADDEKHLSFTIMFCEGHFGRLSTVFILIFYLCLLLISFGVICPIGGAIYVIFHVTFQFYLLNDGIRKIPGEDLVGKNRLTRKLMHQRTIYESLSVCAKHHSVIKMATNSFVRKTQNTFMLTFFVLTLLAFVSASCCLIFDLSPSSNWKMILSLAFITSLSLAICMCGQKIIDESNQFFVTLCNTPWYHWDRRSKMALGMMLINSLEPYKINCFGLVDLGYPLILSGARIMYSLLTISWKFK